MLAQPEPDQPMRIAFDPQVFLLQEYGGISRYVCSLARQLAAYPDVDARIIAPLHYNRHLDEVPEGIARGWRVPRVRKTTRLVCSASEFLARHAMREFRPMIVHETYYSRQSLAPKTARRVITVYDMVSERFPAEFGGGQFTDTKKIAVSRADHVLCISENTRRDLIELFGIAPERTSVVYLGCDDLAPPVDAGARNENVSRPYLLYVGSRGGYKNFAALIRAFASSSWLRSNFSVMCCGGGAFIPDELALFRQLQLSDVHVHQISGGDEILASMYKDAAAFVYPSLYEGFGIPPLEAMSLGCPVICGNTSSIPEVVGDAGEYFDPNDTESVRTAIENVLQSTNRSNDLVAKGHARRALFSWERCARETLDIYRSIL
jgi:glycosyltransferase involved in cell wall biosynthesis